MHVDIRQGLSPDGDTLTYRGGGGGARGGESLITRIYLTIWVLQSY